MVTVSVGMLIGLVLAVVLLLVHIMLFVGCWCAMVTRFAKTDIESHHTVVMAWTLFQAMYINEFREVTSDRDYLVELVAAMYVFGYTAGKHQAAYDPATLDSYVRRHAVTKPFHNILVPLVMRAHEHGRESIYE